MTQHIRFNDDAEYEPSDSEDDYNENDKKLLEKVRRKKEAFSDSEEEVLGVGGDSSLSNESDIALSDIDGEDDDNLPNAKAWGKDKRDYYYTDYVDQDYGGHAGKDGLQADFEEEEAKNLQIQLAKELEDDDFMLDISQKVKESDKDLKTSQEIVQTDISTLSKRQKIQLLLKESPEFFGLMDDYKEKMSIVKDFLQPVIDKAKKGEISDCEALSFVKIFYDLVLNYCTNILMYLLLKSKRSVSQTHPIIKRLYQYRQLILQTEPVFKENIKPQLEVLLAAKSKENKNTKTTNKNQLKLLTNIISKSKDIPVIETVLKKKNKEKELKSILHGAKAKENNGKKVQFGENEVDDSDKSESNMDEDNVEELTEDMTELDGDGKRKITYQMAKNKGLMPSRKKEQRNPRVKHRNKFRKANIRRKGAVREVRTELVRYGGEMSGIKASVTKGIKIK